MQMQEIRARQVHLKGTEGTAKSTLMDYVKLAIAKLALGDQFLCVTTPTPIDLLWSGACFKKYF